MSAPAATRLDGRLVRGARSRAAVVDALLALLEEGHLRPTAAQIADRAGVSLRSIFQHFADVDALFAAAADRQIERVGRLLGDVPRSGPLTVRLAAFVRRRTRLWEVVDPVRRASVLMEPYSRELATRLARARRLARAEVEVAFEPELARRPAEQRRDLIAALATVAEWSTWDALRRQQGLSAARARRVVARTLAAVLALD